MTGKLIVFEGGEGAGKTTQIQRLLTWLQNSALIRRLLSQGSISEIVATREPGGTSLGRDIRHLLLGHGTATVAEGNNAEPEAIAPQTELLLYAADRAQHVQQFLRPHLENNALVLCDRFTDSTIAYQGYGRGLDLEVIETLNTIATDGLQSDLTLWLDMDVDEGLARTQKRGHADRMEKNHRTFHEKVRQGFQSLALQYPLRMVRIDASQDVEAVAAAIRGVVGRRLGEWYGRGE